MNEQDGINYFGEHDGNGLYGLNERERSCLSNCDRRVKIIANNYMSIDHYKGRENSHRYLYAYTEAE